MDQIYYFIVCFVLREVFVAVARGSLVTKEAVMSQTSGTKTSRIYEEWFENVEMNVNVYFIYLFITISREVLGKLQLYFSSYFLH